MKYCYLLLCFVIYCTAETFSADVEAREPFIQVQRKAPVDVQALLATCKRSLSRQKHLLTSALDQKIELEAKLADAEAMKFTEENTALQREVDRLEESLKASENKLAETTANFEKQLKKKEWELDRTKQAVRILMGDVEKVVLSSHAEMEVREATKPKQEAEAQTGTMRDALAEVDRLEESLKASENKLAETTANFEKQLKKKEWELDRTKQAVRILMGDVEKVVLSSHAEMEVTEATKPKQEAEAQTGTLSDALAEVIAPLFA